jgi:hypothetical protein
MESVPVAKGLSFARFGSTPAALLIGSADKAITLYSLHFERLLPAMPKGSQDWRSVRREMRFTAHPKTARRGDYAVVANGARQWTQNHGAVIHDLALSPDGNLSPPPAKTTRSASFAAANGGNGPQPHWPVSPRPSNQSPFHSTTPTSPPEQPITWSWFTT